MGPRKAHFIGICGAGMSAAAFLLREAGWVVSGSDQGFYPPLSDLLEREGMDCRTPHAASNIPEDVEWIVVGKHAKLTLENPEVAEAFRRQELGLSKVLSFPEVLSSLLENTTNIVVAGSFGKSTTSALLSWLARSSGLPIGYFIGAVPANFSKNSELGEGKVFVLEGDEYPSSNWDDSSKFEHYRPTAVVLTSCAHDHFNVFPTREDYLAPFHRLVKLLPENGLLIANKSGEDVMQVVESAQCRVVLYSDAPDEVAYHARNARYDGDGVQSFDFYRGSECIGAFDLTMLGEHNVSNAVAALAAAIEVLDIPVSSLQRGLPEFLGLRRRLERKFQSEQVVVYEDLSSSRPKAMAALAAIRNAYPGRQIAVVFQPHTFSFRSTQATDWYPGMFDGADLVGVFVPPNFNTQAEQGLLSYDQILDSIKGGNSMPILSISNREEFESFATRLRPPCAVLVMTSGGFEGQMPTLIELASQLPLAAN